MLWPLVSRVQLASTTTGLLSNMPLLKNLARDELAVAHDVVFDEALKGALPAGWQLVVVVLVFDGHFLLVSKNREV